MLIAIYFLNYKLCDSSVELCVTIINKTVQEPNKIPQIRNQQTLITKHAPPLTQ